ISLIVLLSLSIMLATLWLLAAPFALGQSDIPLSQPIQGVLATNNNDLYTYPTDFTQGIMPKTVHSHNDYWRPKPFYSALSNGVISVEADVWLYNGTLYKQNPSSPFVTAPTKNGVFDTDAGQTLYLWVDVKTDGPSTWPYVVRALEPLRAGGWLTKYNGTGITNGTVTVIGTGNTPRAQVESLNERDYFFDGPLSTLNGTANTNITQFLSPIASTSFKASFGWPRAGKLNETALAKLRGQIASASARGIGTRYWETPNWPIGNRNAIWRLLYNEGATLINADDLAGIANFWDGDL
ncbi:unnamed protein product, partial [Aureobasidium pullulans]